MDANLKEILSKFNLSLIDYIDPKNVLVEDKLEYKYKINLYNIINSAKLPHLFSRNPFAIDNIKNYLKINNTGLILLSEEYVDCKHKLAFICEKHKDKGIQYKPLDWIVNDKQYCRYCGIERRAEGYRIADDIILKRCDELDLIYVGRYVKNQSTWIKYQCKKHMDKGVQDIEWYHLKTCAVGCPYCIGRYKTTKDFVNEMQDINPNIKIIGEYNGCENSVDCECLICGHKWSPVGRSLKFGQGCPACTMSKGEIKIKQILDNQNIQYITQHTYDDCVYREKLKFDFYLPDYNMCIEYDGQQHFEPVDFANKGIEWATKLFELNQIKDAIKNNYCRDKNIRLLRIPYWDFDNIETILASEI